MLKPESPLTETDLLTAGSKLYDLTGVFDWAEVDPKTQITTQTTEDVLVKVHEAKKNEFTYGFGFEVINRGGSIPSGTVALPNLPPVGLPTNFKTSQKTFWGPRGTFQYTRNNFRGKGETISVTGFGGRLDQRFAIYYINPFFRWTNWKATTSFSTEHNQENPIFSSQQEIGGFQMQRYIDKSQKNTLFLRYQFSQTNIPQVLIDAAGARRRSQRAAFHVRRQHDPRHARQSPSTSTAAGCSRSNSTRTPPSWDRASTSPSSPARSPTTSRHSTTSCGPTAFASDSPSPTPTAAFR